MGHGKQPSPGGVEGSGHSLGVCLQKTNVVMLLIDVQRVSYKVKFECQLFGCRDGKAREEAVATAPVGSSDRGGDGEKWADLPGPGRTRVDSGRDAASTLVPEFLDGVLGGWQGHG